MIILFLLICLVPSAGLLTGGHRISQENRRMTDKPSLLKEDGTSNTDFLKDSGDYFAENFAYRNELVTGYDLILETVFGVSGQDGVIVGKNKWLYYKDSLDDYQGAHLLTGRQLFDVARSMAMMQDYAEKKGLRFVFTIAPDKNELYPDSMPYYYSFFRNKVNNFDGILPELEREGVHYADTYTPLKDAGEILYHKRDSHWTNKGAAIASHIILKAVGQKHHNYANDPYKKRKDFNGDLNVMLYPSLPVYEANEYYDPMPDFNYEDDNTDYTSPKINTRSQKGEGSLIMYRDSFGNALLPFFAEAFKEAYFSKAAPYYLTDLETADADVLVVERAERFLPEMAQNPPLIPAEPLSPDKKTVKVRAQDLKEEDMGDYTIVSGYFARDSRIPDRAKIYITVNGKNCFEAAPLSDERGREGFVLFINHKYLNNKDNEYLAAVSAGESD